MNNLNDIFFAPVANQDLTYDQVLEDVQRYFAENHASTIAEAGEGNAERATTLLKELMVQYIVKRKYAIEGLTTEELCEKLYEDMAGYSFLKKWIYKPGIEEVNINAYNDIEVIEAGGRSIKIPDKFSSPQHAIDVVRRMLNACGMVIDDTMPSVVGFLDKNIRISVDKTPIVDPDVGINASIRIVNQQTVSEQKLLDSGSATAEMLHFLMACIRYGVSVCIAGSTGSGKTTIMAWLLSNVPNNQRLITIEEGSREFDLVKRDENGNILNSVIHLLTRPSENPALNINQDFLLERVLRKHPNVIGVGEMRSAAESLSAAESSRTGHTVCTTIHSNSCNSTYRRMMTLAKRKYSMDDAVLMEIMVEAYPMEGMHFESCQLTESRMYIKVVNTRLEAEVVPGDIVQSGIIISNSEVGLGSVNIQPLVYRLVCSNGMVVNDAQTRRTHVGRVNEASENYQLYSEKTLEADDKAFAMKIQDTVRAVVDEVRFTRVVNMMREAKEARINTTDVPGIVKLVSKDFHITDEESSGVLQRLIEGNDLTLYGLSNAVTRHSQDVQDYDRATALEGIGYNILSMPARQWSRINQLAA
ncbi:ATPase, T2SS/T4P/T4SS family [Ruthenibacterium sp. CLA-JM-H11]|uniref:ATPase, T2SS/T4P/T4SS family n=1 Tax=Ruthenibacterium intestinale TaxID=3133163 RepID=A0ABV1GCD7_9FIRM